MADETESAVGFFKNIVIKLKAAGPFAVIGIWCISLAAVGMFGSGDTAKSAVTYLGFAGPVIIILTLFRTK